MELTLANTNSSTGYERTLTYPNAFSKYCYGFAQIACIGWGWSRISISVIPALSNCVINTWNDANGTVGTTNYSICILGF